MAKPSYEDLWDENVVLKARLATLLNDQPAIALKQHYRLPGMQAARVLLLLFERRRLSKEVLYGLVFEQDNGDGPSFKIVDVVVCKLRRALRDAGAPGGIETIHGAGYGLSDRLHAQIAAVLRPEERAAA